MTLLALFACAARHVEPGLPPEPGRVTILHTNDIHGHFVPEPAEWRDDRAPVGGFVRLEGEVRATRANRPRGGVLLLDGGDLLTGTPLTDLVERDSKGGAMHDFLEALDYDAVVVGNHEFDKGLDNLIEFTDGARVPVLSSNVRTPDGAAPLLPNQTYSQVFEASGVKVGVIGVTTDGLKTLMSRKDYARLKLVDPEKAVREEIAKLDPTTDLIVVLSHMGVDDDERLARNVDGIDLIVGGHSHTRLTAARRVDDTWIVQAGSYTRSLGVVDLVVSDDRIVDFDYELRDLLAETMPVEPSPAVAALAQTYAERIDAVYGEVLSEAPVALGRDYHHESGLGRWITDVLRESTGADVALYNGGGLRADLPAGPVSRGSLFACFPFQNDVMTFQLTGKDLQGILLRNVIAEADEKRGFLPVSGVRYTWRVRNGAPELLEAFVGDTPLDLDRTYTIATNSYITEQWEKHLGVQPKELQAVGMSDFEAAVRFATKGPVAIDGEPRAKRVE